MKHIDTSGFTSIHLQGESLFQHFTIYFSLIKQSSICSMHSEYETKMQLCDNVGIYNRKAFLPFLQKFKFSYVNGVRMNEP